MNKREEEKIYPSWEKPKGTKWCPECDGFRKIYWKDGTGYQFCERCNQNGYIDE